MYCLLDKFQKSSTIIALSQCEALSRIYQMIQGHSKHEPNQDAQGQNTLCRCKVDASFTLHRWDFL